MNSEDAIVTAIRELVDAGELAGAVTLVWRGGEVIQQASVGYKDITTGQPLTRDTLFRIASMTINSGADDGRGRTVCPR